MRRHLTVNFDSVRVVKLRETQEKDLQKSILLLSESILLSILLLTFK